MQADIKDILYSAIEEIGKEKLSMQIITEIERSEACCNEILEKCKSKVSCDLDEETLGILCEALLHFLLTASVLPSGRRVSWKGADLDIVVPSLKMLSRSPDKALVIQIIRRDTDLTKIQQAECVQPYYENIWIVSASKLNINRKNYYIGSGNFHYCRIISDINTFLVRKGDRGLKLLHG